MLKTFRVTIIALCVLSATCSVARSDERVAAMDKAWRERGNKIKSARVRWEVTSTFPAGGLNNDAQMIALPIGSLSAKIKNGLKIPPKDVSIVTQHSISIVGKTVRYEYDSIDWSLKGETALPHVKPHRVIATPHYTKSYDPAGVGDGKAPVGLYLKDKYVRDSLGPASLPIIVHCLTNQPHYDVYAISKLGQIVINKEHAKIIHLSCQINKPPETINLWCENTEPFLIRRIEHYDIQKQLTNLVTIEYRPDTTLGSFVSRWSATRFDILDRSVVLERLDAIVKEYSLNEEILESDLEFEFDKGTIVFGGNNGKHIVGDNGKAHMLTNEDLMRPYDELVQIVETRRSIWKRWSTYVMLLFGFTLIGFLFIIRRRLVSQTHAKRT